MKKGINKVILLGHAGKDPEVRYMQDGKPVANVSLATSESWKDKNTGEEKQQTEWHKLVFYAGLAEVCKNYVHKGSKIYVEGRINTRKWQDKQGADHYTTEIICHDLQLLDAKKTESQEQPQQPPPAMNFDDIPF